MSIQKVIQKVESEMAVTQKEYLKYVTKRLDSHSYYLYGYLQALRVIYPMLLDIEKVE